MPIEPKSKKERKTKRNPYSIDFSDEERKKLKTFAEEHGYSSESKVIKDALRVIYKETSGIDPTTIFNPDEFLKTFETKSAEAIQEQYEVLLKFNDRLTNVESLIEGIALEVGMTKKDIKKLQKKDITGEVIFE